MPSSAFVYFRAKSSMSALVALSAIVSAVGTPDRASAGFIVTVTEVGSDLLFEYSGGFTGLATRTSGDTDPSLWGYRQNVFAAQDNVGGENPTRGGLSIFDGTYSVGPANFFPGAATEGLNFTLTASPGSGTVWFDNVRNRFNTTSSFTSGSYSTSGSFTIPSKSYADLGLPQNSSNSWNWTQTGQSFVPGNTLTIVTVPEPLALAIATVGGAIAIASRVIRRRRVAAD